MKEMLGIPDPWVSAAFVLCIASSALCVIYGLVTWGSREEAEPPEITEKWAKEEDEVEEGI